MTRRSGLSISLVTEWDVFDVESDGSTGHRRFLSQEHQIIIHQKLVNHGVGGVGAGGGNVNVNNVPLIEHLHV